LPAVRTPDLDPTPTADDPESDSPATDDSPLSASSAAPAQPSTADEELAWARSVLIDHYLDRELDGLHLSDLQREIGKDALDRWRNTFKKAYAFRPDTKAAQDELQRKIRRLADTGRTNDQIAYLIRPDLAVMAENSPVPGDEFANAWLGLRSILNPDQARDVDQQVEFQTLYGRHNFSWWSYLTQNPDALKDFVNDHK
jgi:hypothetical protein